MMIQDPSPGGSRLNYKPNHGYFWFVYFTYICAHMFLFFVFIIDVKKYINKGEIFHPMKHKF